MFLFMALVLLSIKANADTIFDFIDLDLATTSRYYYVAAEGDSNNKYSKGFKAEAKFNYKYENIRFNGLAFTNWDSTDDSRSYSNIRQANIYVNNNNFTFGLGVDTFFWGVSESINVVNVLNQSDIMESLDGKVKYGQTFVSINTRFSNGDFSFYYLPLFQEQSFPERPSYGLAISKNAVFEHDKKRGGIAARGLFYFDRLEFALSYFKGTRRSALLARHATEMAVLTPYYIQTVNYLVDGVYIAEDFTLKFEAKTGLEQNAGFTTFNLGIEYPSYAFSKLVEEVIFIAEYAFDDRKLSAETHGQNDIFLGGKFNFGYSEQGNVRFLYSYDFDYRSQYAELSYEYRLNDYFRFKAKALKVLSAPERDQRLYALSGEEFINLSLHYAF